MESKIQTALITGASGGIGYELAKLFARDHYNLVLVARSAEKLNQVAAELQSQFGIAVKTVALDLAAAPAAKFLFDQLQREGLTIDVLVNNAGFGGFGEFAEMPEDEILGQIQLNICSAYSSDAVVPAADAGEAQREGYECGLYRRFSAGAADGGLLCHQGLRAFVFGGAGE